MNKTCSQCSLVFEREQGYFMGAMVFAYFFGALSVIPTVVFLVFVLKTEMFWTIAGPSIQIVLLNPILFKYSKLAWIYLDQRADPAGDA